MKNIAIDIEIIFINCYIITQQIEKKIRSETKTSNSPGAIRGFFSEGEKVCHETGINSN